MSRNLEKEYQRNFITFSPNTFTHSSGLIIFFVTLKVKYFFVSRNNEIRVCTGTVYLNVINSVFMYPYLSKMEGLSSKKHSNISATFWENIVHVLFKNGNVKY
jgi:hypothetical protein